MRPLLTQLVGYCLVAGLGSFSAFLLVSQFLPKAASQTDARQEGNFEEIQELPDIDEALGEETLSELNPTAPEQMPSEVSEELRQLEDQSKGIETDLGTIDSLVNEGYAYEPKGKRNPFKPYASAFFTEPGVKPEELLPLQRFDLSELEVVGIMWDIRRPRALVISPDKEVHFIEPNDKIGQSNGYVAVIREGEVVVVESFEEDGEIKYNTRVLTLKK